MLDFTCVRSHGRGAHADARHVGVELIAVGVSRTRRTASSRPTVGSRRRAACAPGSRRSRPRRRARRPATAQRHAAVPHVDAAADEAVVRHASSPLATRCRRRGAAPSADAVVVCFMTQRRRSTSSRVASLRRARPGAAASPSTAKVLGELVARIDADAARAGLRGELLADAEARLLSRAPRRAHRAARCTCLPSTSQAVEVSARSGSSDSTAPTSARTFVSRRRRQVQSSAAICVSPAGAPSCTALAPSSSLSSAASIATRTPAASLVVAAVEHFVVGDDEDRVEVLVAARHRLA